MDVPEKMIEALKRPARDCFRKETYNRYYKAALFISMLSYACLCTCTLLPISVYFTNNWPTDKWVFFTRLQKVQLQDAF